MRNPTTTAATTVSNVSNNRRKQMRSSTVLTHLVAVANCLFSIKKCGKTQINPIVLKVALWGKSPNTIQEKIQLSKIYQCKPQIKDWWTTGWLHWREFQPLLNSMKVVKDMFILLIRIDHLCNHKLIWSDIRYVYVFIWF